MTVIELAEIRDWARTGGEIALRMFRRAQVTRKADNSQVTEADVAVEQFLRERIEQRYPEHGIMGEEQGSSAIDREFVWSLDPIDGTGGFVAGLPVWGVSIGLLRHGRPYLGVFYLPVADECYWNDLEGGAYCNDQPLKIEGEHLWDVNDSESGLLVPSDAHRRYDIRFRGKTRSLGSTAAHCCYVVRGGHLGALVGRPHLWDIAGVLPVLYAAGGTAVLLSGAAFEAAALLDGRPVAEPLLVCAPALVEPLLATIQRRGTA